MNLLNLIGSSLIKITYDIGDSASFDYNIQEEFSTYGNYIGNIHIKDRVKGGFSVELGTGNVNFNKFFDALSKFKNQKTLIMQAYRDDEGLEIFKSQLIWFKNKLNSWHQNKEISQCQL